MMRVAAVILAGGKGERLGGAVKANLEVGGRRLIDRVLASLGPLPRPVIVAHGAIPSDDLRPPDGIIAIADLETGYAGPLAGVAAAVACCVQLDEAPDVLVTIAVDTPFVPRDYVERLLAALAGGTAPAVIARHGSQDYPTNMAWRIGTLATLPDRLRTGTAPRSLRRLAEEAGAVGVSWPATDAGDPFANVNTPADLAAMQARARFD